VRAAALYAANIPLRALYEAAWTLEWVLTKDPEVGPRRFLVGFLRDNRRAAARLKPSTPEANELRRIVSEELSTDWTFSAEQEALADQTIGSATDLLNGELAHINAAFESASAKRSGREPRWYQVSVDGGPRASSIRDIVKQLRRLNEYEYLYSTQSKVQHAAAFLGHVTLGGGQAGIEPSGLFA
jgi:hypothetical protein